MPEYRSSRQRSGGSAVKDATRAALEQMDPWAGMHQNNDRYSRNQAYNARAEDVDDRRRSRRRESTNTGSRSSSKIADPPANHKSSHRASSSTKVSSSSSSARRQPGSSSKSSSSSRSSRHEDIPPVPPLPDLKEVTVPPLKERQRAETVPHESHRRQGAERRRARTTGELSLRRRHSDEDEHAHRACQAEQAERKAYREAGVKGTNLREQQKKLQQHARFEAFARNKPATTKYQMAGQTYYAQEHPQEDPVEAVAARYNVAIQHEARMARRSASPYGATAEELGRTSTQQNKIAAIPKEEFDQMFKACREANRTDMVEEVKFFDIPNARDSCWFKVALPEEKPKKLRKSAGSSNKKKEDQKSDDFLRRMSNLF